MAIYIDVFFIAISSDLLRACSLCLSVDSHNHNLWITHDRLEHKKSWRVTLKSAPTQEQQQLLRMIQQQQLPRMTNSGDRLYKGKHQ